MENLIYNELKMRGYLVDIGVVEINKKNKNGNYQRKQLEVTLSLIEEIKGIIFNPLLFLMI